MLLYQSGKRSSIVSSLDNHRVYVVTKRSCASKLVRQDIAAYMVVTCRTRFEMFSSFLCFPRVIKVTRYPLEEELVCWKYVKHIIHEVP